MSTPETNLSSAEPAAALTPPASGVANRSIMRLLPVLIRRELWEYSSVWKAPLVVAILLLASGLFVQVGPVPFGDAAVWSNERTRAAMLALIQWGLTVPQYIVMLILVSYYLLDCLYAERKDRSILFWKSMPVSDGTTVISKLLTALVVVPLGMFALALLTSLLFSAILALRVRFGGLPPGVPVWNTVVWLKVQALMLYGVIVSMLWYAPAAAYLMLVSAWARRNVLLWASLPPVIAILIEQHAFGTHFVTSLIEYRTFGIWDALNLDQAAERTVHLGHNSFVSLPGVFDTLNVAQPFLNIDLWLGVAVAAALVFVAARIRRYRDDT